MKKILETAFLSDVDEKLPNGNDGAYLSNLLFTERELNVVETELGKTLTPAKVQNAMKLLRGFQNSASGADLETTSVSAVYD